MISKNEIKYIQSLSDKKTRDEEDVFIARLDTSLGVSTSEIKNSKENISIIPNPFSNQVSISFYVTHPESTTLKIVGLDGKPVFQGERISWIKGENHFMWNAAEEAAGVYLVQIESAGDFLTEKLILIK